MDEKQAALDEQLALVIAEATQSRVSMTEAIVLIRKMEKAGWSFTNKAAEDESKRKADEEKQKQDEVAAAEKALMAKNAKVAADAKIAAAPKPTPQPTPAPLGMGPAPGMGQFEAPKFDPKDKP